MTNSPATQTPVLDILFAYVDQGFSIIPIFGIKGDSCACGSKDCEGNQRGKHPNWKLAVNGVNSATRDKGIIREWVKKAPDGNWAVRGGMPLADGKFLVVADIDPRNGGDLSLSDIEHQLGKLPLTPTQDTGGNGNHFLMYSDKPTPSHAPAPGIEVIGEGKYFLVYPSRHISGGSYTWAMGLAPEDVDFALAPRWVTESDGKGSEGRPVRDGGTARETVLGEAFAQAGMLGVDLPGGSIAVECPWSHEHSDNRGKGSDTSTVILPPAGGSQFGGFKCMHSHCSQRTWIDVLNRLPQDAASSARRKYPFKLALVEEEPAAEPVSEGEEETPQKREKRLIAECRNRLDYDNSKGGNKLKNDSINGVTILTYDPRWAGIIRCDDFAHSVRFTRDPQWHSDDKPRQSVDTLTDTAMTCIDLWLKRYWGLKLSDQELMKVVNTVAKRDSYNPVQDWMNGLKWDGVRRLDMWTQRYLGTSDTEYHRVAGRKWLISAVARAYEPGCKADHVLILEGSQGRGKSTALEVLASKAWFTDTPIEIGNKDAYLSIQGKLIVELGELTSLKGRDIDRVKAFFTSPTDRFRSPYGRITEDFPRQCVFAGTVNPEEYLSDPTGNRRFWPIKCGIIDLAALAEDRDQLWAEAVYLYKQWVARGSKTSEHLWWPTHDEQERLFSAEQDERVVTDSSWESAVADWLMSNEGQRHLKSEGYVTVRAVLEHCLKIEVADQDAGKVSKVGKVLASLKWVKVTGMRSKGGAKLNAYKPSNVAAAR